MSKTSDMPAQASPRTTSRRRAAAQSPLVRMPSIFHLSHAPADANAEIEKWLKVVESHLRQVPRRSKV